MVGSSIWACALITGLRNCEMVFEEGPSESIVLALLNLLSFSIGVDALGSGSEARGLSLLLAKELVTAFRTLVFDADYQTINSVQGN